MRYFVALIEMVERKILSHEYVSNLGCFIEEKPLGYGRMRIKGNKLVSHECS